MSLPDTRLRPPTGPLAACRQAFARVFSANSGTTVSAPHIRAPSNVDRVLAQFVVASVPALLIGAWSAGAVALTAIDAGETIDSLLYRVLVDVSMLEIGQIPGVTRTVVGIALFVPVLLTATVTSLFWAWAFAAGRNRPIDAGWLMTAWLYALLLPPSVPLYLAAIGLSFGAVLGQHIFGGTGRYLVSPALLGAVSLQVAYPDALIGGAILPNETLTSTWALLAVGELPTSWLQSFVGREVGAFGTPSALACFVGAAYLCYRKIVSARIIAGALIAASIAAIVINSLADGEQTLGLPWYGHLAVGNFAFAVAFLATDPTTAPTTRAGRWIFGALVGTVTVLIRLVDDSHPEGSLVALMLCSLAIPLIDHVAVRRYIRRRSLIGGAS
jgi:Na+-transporting NADH:ubiquinone oxidoreductase subunit B